MDPRELQANPRTSAVARGMRLVPGTYPVAIPKEVSAMKTREAQELAARLGLSAWVSQVVAAGEEGNEAVVELKCVGFSSADFPRAEAETWREAFDGAFRIAFGA